MVPFLPGAPLTPRLSDRRKLGDNTAEINTGCRALTSSVRPAEEISLSLASQHVAAAFRYAERDAVGSELAAQAKVQTFASGTEYPSA